MGGSRAARKRRVRRVLELSTAGMTIPDISAKMKQEGFAASERTVWNDQHSIEAKDYQEEILRKQLVDITIADTEVRLKYRDKLLDKLMPRKIEQKLTGAVTQEVEVKIPELKGLDEDAVGAIVQNFMDDEARRLRQTEPELISSTEEQPEPGLDPS